MGNRVVVCTSTSGLDNVTQPHHILALRLHVRMDGRDLLDGKDISAHAFQQWLLDHPQATASTSPPTQPEIMAMFEQLIAGGFTEALIITLSSRISKTHELVQQTAKVFAHKIRTHVYDSRAAGHAEAVLALEADRCIAKGMGIAQTVQRLDALRTNSRILFTVASLDTLVRTGRISAAAGMLGNMIRMRPVLQFDAQGAIEVVSRILTTDRALEGMTDLFSRFVDKNRFSAYMVSFGVDDTSQKLMRTMQARFRLPDLEVYPAPPVLAAYTGPDAAGLMVVRHPAA